MRAVQCTHAGWAGVYSHGASTSLSLARTLPDGSEIDHLEAMLAAKFAWLDFGFVKQHLLRLKWRSIDHVGKVQVPICFVVGLKDEIVPSFHSAQLQKAAVSAPFIHRREVPDGMHNDTWSKAGPSFLRWVHDFVAMCEAADGDKKRL